MLPLTTQSPAPEIRVKFLSKARIKNDASEWLKRFPNKTPRWGNCSYIFDPNCRNYDWLVVYDDLPPNAKERRTIKMESLPDSCPKSRTLLITTEPSTIKVYGRSFTRQFGHILTSQEPWIMHHPGAIFSQTGLIPFYGSSGERGSYDSLTANVPVNKSSLISTVCSAKQQSHTLHRARYNFTQKLKHSLPALDIFGHGVRPISDKADALDSYRYHLAIENHLCPHHWTEKLSDAFLGGCLPFYHGCPNYTDYFPKESVIPIDIEDFDGALRIISEAMNNGEYEKRLPYILESRNRVLNEHGLFPLLTRIISNMPATPPEIDGPGLIYSRHALRKKNPIMALQDAYEKITSGFYHRFLR
jgi:hypothetical protein